MASGGLFISYSHADRAWLKQFHTQLRPLVRRGLVLWDDTHLAPGSRWHDEIDAAIARSTAALLLVSPDFLASDFIQQAELEPLLRAEAVGNLAMLWVHVRACLYDQTAICRIQGAHDVAQPLDSLAPPKRGAVIAQICRRVQQTAMPYDAKAGSSKESSSAPPVDITGQPCRVRYTLVLSGHVDADDKPLVEALLSQLRAVADDAQLTLIRLEAGSIKLTLEGTWNGFDRVQEAFVDGSLVEVTGREMLALYAATAPAVDELAVDELAPSAKSRATVRLHLLGRPRWAGGLELSRKDAALLALLALDGPQTRAVLAARLWPGVDDTKAADSLRQRISRLRRSTGHLVVNFGATLTLADGVAVDARSIAALDDDALHDAGDLLAGFAYDDNEFFDGWVNCERERCLLERVDALAIRAAVLEGQGRVAEALRLNERILDVNPLHEHGLQRQMRLHYLRGDRIAAIHAFERFEALLRDQTGGRPGDETLKLLRVVENAQRVAPVRGAVLPESLLRPPRLVGRDAEWEAMSEAWRTARPFLLMGDAGMGKSRLLADFVQDAAGIVVEQGRPGDAQTPYAVLARTLRAVHERFAPTLADTTRRELARILPELGPPPAAAGQQSTLWRAIETLLQEGYAAGLGALIVDDLHHADLATIDTLRWLSASPALRDLRLGLAARPVDGAAGDALRRWLDDSARPIRIMLRALSRSDVAELIATLALPHLDSVDLADKLLRQASGHPLFTLEMLKAYVLLGAIDGAIPQPATVQTLLEQRLRHLPPETDALLHVAAVFGNELTVERATQLLAHRPVNLADAWAALESAHILRGTRFVHDLVQDCAQRLLPTAIRSGLHSAIAEMLSGQAGIAPGRVAEHWEAAERWGEAARDWHAAGIAAGHTGRLVEQKSLLERAAACARRAGDVTREFDTLHGRLEGMMIHTGAAAVLDEVAPLHALAQTDDRRLKIVLIEAEALLGLERVAEAMGLSERALAWAGAHPALLANAMAIHGVALAQTGHTDEAIDLLRRGSETAEREGTSAQTIRVLNSLLLVLYEAGRVPEAIAVGRDIVRRAEAVGDQSTMIAAEGNVVDLLLLQGDPEGAYEPARRVRLHYVEMGLSGSSLAGINLIAVGVTAAYVGYYDEALHVLVEAAQLLGPHANPAMLGKARIALANVWLALGCSAEAREALGALGDGAPSWAEVQWHACLARADAMNARSTNEHYRGMADAMANAAGTPIVQRAWTEWSRQGDAAAVVARLREVELECERLGLAGTARTLRLRQIDRLAEIGSTAARREAAELADGLYGEMGRGFQASTYMPEAWLILETALRAAGNETMARRCRMSARRWIERAAPRVPSAYRAAFLSINPINRVALS